MNDICIQDSKRTFKSYDPTIKLTSSSHERDLWAAVLTEAVETSCEDTQLPKYLVDRSKCKLSDREIGNRISALDRKRKEKSVARRFINDKEGMCPVICDILDINYKSLKEKVAVRWTDAI